MGPTNVCCRRCLPLRRPPPPLLPLFTAPCALPLLPLLFLAAKSPGQGRFAAKNSNGSNGSAHGAVNNGSNGGGGRRKGKQRRQQTFVGPMDHSYRVVN